MTASVMVGIIAFSGGASASSGPSVHGGGMVTLPAQFDDLAGDPVYFQLQAHGVGEAAAGRFNVVHLDDAGGLYAHAVGDVTCLSVVGGVASATGIIRHAWFRDFPGSSVVGMAVAITVADNGSEDALGFHFEFFGEPTIAPCADVTPFVAVDRGNFAVRSG